MHRHVVLAAVLAAAAWAAAPAAAQQRAAATPPVATRSAPIDINAASVDSLQAVDGIGPVRARAIVANRPYRTKFDLVRRGILPRSVYNGVRDRLIAHRPRSF